MSTANLRITGAALAAGGTAGTAWAVWQGTYTSLLVNLGSGVIRTNYNQAFAYCASPLGQLSVAKSSVIAVTCQDIGNMTAWCTVALVCGILAVIAGALVAFLVPFLRGHLS